GLSLIDLPGQCMYNPKADRALFAAIKQELNPEVVELHEEYLDINDEIFALMLAKKLESIMTEFYKK
ncbi:MAG: Tm-1-like ATP-binding domain-containing protein, partial [Oscillospiraceae bacterium]